MKDLRPSDISFVTAPWKPSGDGENVVINEKRAAPLWEAIKLDSTWPPAKDPGQPLLKTEPEQIYVDVLNGTSTKGKAKKVAKELREAGYRVVEVGNAPGREIFASTTVKYDPMWDASAKTIIFAAGAQGESVPKHGERMTLIIGEDFTSIKDVTISKIAGDQSADLNTADETYCAA